ncbi:MAG: ABC transporter ATP-binding protein [Candidatus Limnocylindrales bacterium]
MSFLVLEGVHKQFPGGVTAVEDFNLAAARGEFVSFLGPSGCGKTTTLRMIAGFERATAGTITIDGREVTNVPPNRRNVGMVFQAYALFPNMDVLDNIGFGLRVRGRPRAEIRKRAAELLELVHLEGRGDRYPYQLSGGQQQRVALARALAFEPQVLLLDEPLSALDAKIRVSLRGEIRAIQRQLGITTVYVTHDQEEALSLSDRVVVMSEGRIEQIGTPFEVYNTPSTPFVARFVGTLSTVTGSVIDAGDGRARVAGSDITVTGGLTGTGSRVSIALRPESLKLGDAGGANRLAGEVVDVTFLGSIVRVRVRLPEDAGTVSIDTFNNPSQPPPSIGEAVAVSFPPAASLVIDAEVAATLVAEPVEAI